LKIRSFSHKGLQRLFVDGVPSGVPPEVAAKLRRMLSYLCSISGVEELRALRQWKAHPLKGARAGVWSLQVTGNWRLTFRIEADGQSIAEVNLEDYH